MLKLIYHTAVFGPIELEYDRPVIRVGRNEDNDLVLLHPSIQPYHCLLIFRGEKLRNLPPQSAISTPDDLWCLGEWEFGPSDTLQIGELNFSLAHSARTVAIPGCGSASPPAGLPEAGDTAVSRSPEALPWLESQHRAKVPSQSDARQQPAEPQPFGPLKIPHVSAGQSAGALPDSSAVGMGPGPAEAERHRYYCEFCRVFYEDNAVKRMGLVGHAKRDLCPKCGRQLAPHR